MAHTVSRQFALCYCNNCGSKIKYHPNDIFTGAFGSDGTFHIKCSTLGCHAWVAVLAKDKTHWEEEALWTDPGPLRAIPVVWGRDTKPHFVSRYSHYQ